ncbi:uncharacterized protein LOC124487175 isoform X2 [Hypomesus transpacificus]|uniref:uncharacterized protein LOC124487175 isoform X2 n=1 Tax=Hypomesus transpacificus TaxID=137520 RepID=UPI001F07E59F|nr:uncharacterized protein LOC124487175 isoform X2 [Hypomesus transpacificus]
MKHVVGCLLLSSLCSLSSWGIHNLVVTQSPREVTVKEGNTVHIHCCWKMDPMSNLRAKVVWKRNKPTIDSTSSFQRESAITGPCHEQAQPHVACNCSNLILSNVTVNDSGLYICKVNIDIPVLLQSEGNGTSITVTTIKQVNMTNGKEEEINQSNLLFIIIPLAVLFLAALVCFLIRKHVMDSKNTARVIYEAPHPGSEESDGQSTNSSRGSTQWCQVQLYESIDYFAVEDNKGKG